jgi:predicted ribosome quality control (RQC) complex YloA/Tae2 family protein
MAEGEDVACAADIAAYYSKARGEGKVPVVQASVADLRKPKGAAPGKVLVMKEKVVTARPSQALPAVMEKPE